MADDKNPTQQTVEELAKQVAKLGEDMKTLMGFKAAKEGQQLTFPLDFVSQQIILGFSPGAGPRSFPMGGVKGFGVYYGSGTPNGVVKAAQGSLFLNYAGNSTSSRAYINTDGNTAWTAITTAT